MTRRAAVAVVATLIGTARGQTIKVGTGQHTPMVLTFADEEEVLWVHYRKRRVKLKIDELMDALEGKMTSAVTHGNNSPAVTGSGNSITVE